MNAELRILVVAPPGRSRESLAAIIRTLHPVELFLMDASDWDRLAESATRVGPFNLALVDLCDPHANAEVMAHLRCCWPEIRLLALVDTLRLNNPVAKGANGVLHRGVTAGQLLAVVQQLAGAPAAWSHAGMMVHTGLSGGRLLEK